MPRVLIDVSDVWLLRYREGIAQAIDTMAGLAHQIDNSPTHDIGSCHALLDQLRDQMVDLKRNMESWQLPF
jgi:hypothetical protein